MKTAVEWLENQMKTSKYFYKLMEDINSRSTVAQSDIFEQAKEMEKEQIKEGYIMSLLDRDNKIRRDAEQYYNETYKSE